MVSLAHGRSLSEKRSAQANLRKRRSKVSDRLDTDRFRTIADWYHLAILEVLKIPGCQSVRAIATALGLKSLVCQQALNRLVGLGLVKQVEHRFICMKDQVVGDGIPSDAVKSYHKQHVEKSLVALQQQNAKKRVKTAQRKNGWFNNAITGSRRLER